MINTNYGLAGNIRRSYNDEEEEKEEGRGGGSCLQSRQVCEQFVEVVLVIKAISHEARHRNI